LTTLVTVNSGLDVKGLVLKLAPGGVIFGRVQNSSKSPLPNQQVVALKRRYVEGKIATGIAKIATTHERGQYRLSGLGPGDYYIEVKGNPTVYFPTSTSIGKAESIKLAAGTEFAAGDITVPGFAGRSISGTLSGALPLSRGMPFFLIPADTSISNAPESGIVPVMNLSINEASRTFELRNVFPGAYDLIAKFLGNGRTEPQGYYRSLQTIRVEDENISDVALAFNANINIAGHVMSDTGGLVTPVPSPPPVVARGGVQNPLTLQVRFRQTDEFASHLVYATTTGERLFTVDRNGMFYLPGMLQGRYRVEVDRLPQNSYLADIRVSGRSIMAEGEAVMGDIQSQLDLVIKSDGGSINGVVRTSSIQPVSAARIVLMSSPNESRLSVYQTTTSDSQGQFTLVGIAPGEYRLLALQDIPIGAESTPEFLSNYQRDSKPVVVSRNGRTDVVLTPAPQ
jgi:hypothetical protein